MGPRRRGVPTIYLRLALPRCRALRKPKVGHARPLASQASAAKRRRSTATVPSKKKHGQDRIVLHFTPTSSSWMNLVERFFRDITQDCIREGSFGSIQELVKAITDYLAERNLEPKVYKWKADGKQILEKIQRAREAMAKNNV